MVVFFCNDKMCNRYSINNSCKIMCIVNGVVELCGPGCPHEKCISADSMIAPLPAEIFHICDKQLYPGGTV
jgi:hypothetical protein